MGLDNAGKTTLLRMLKDDRIIEHQPTLHASTYTLVLEGVSFEAVDLGGHETARSLWKKYALWATGIVFLVDAADRTRFPEATEEVHRLLAEPLLSHIPIAVLAQKADLPKAANECELRQALGLEGYVSQDSREIKVFSCSVFQRKGYG